MRADGRDAAHGGDSARKRGQTNSQRALERAQWERRHSDIDFDAAKNQFRKETLPKLSDSTLGEIVKATGLSKRYATLIRRGVVTSHPMHFNALIDLVGVREKANETEDC